MDITVMANKKYCIMGIKFIINVSSEISLEIQENDNYVFVESLYWSYY